MNIINSGSYGEITIREINGEKFAIKTTIETNPSLPSDFLYETTVLRKCDHPNIVKMFDASVDHILQNYSIIMPLAIDDMQKYCEKNDYDELDFIKQIASGLYYLEQNNILHGDIKPENILVYFLQKGKYIPGVRYGDNIFEEDFESKRLLQIADFGVVSLEPNLVPQQSTGSLWYKSPEELVSTLGIHMARDFKSVSWSFGCIIWFLATGKTAFPAGDEIEMIETFSEQLDTRDSEMFTLLVSKYTGNKTLTRNQRKLKLSDSYLDNLLEKCWIMDPEKRISMYEICVYLGLRINKPKSTLDKLRENEIVLGYPDDYDDFLKIIRENDWLSYKEVYFPLACNIFRQTRSKLSDIGLFSFTATCLTLAANLLDDYFDYDDDSLLRIQTQILEAADYKLWSTTAMSYLLIETSDKNKIRSLNKLIASGVRANNETLII